MAEECVLVGANGNRIKVLPLQWWMKEAVEEYLRDPQSDLRDYSSDLVPIDPITGKDGYFYRRCHIRGKGYCWFEYKGMAFEYPGGIRMFPYEFKIADHRVLRRSERDAFITLLNGRRLSKEMREVLYTDTHWHELRAIRREGSLWWIKERKSRKDG